MSEENQLLQKKRKLEDIYSTTNSEERNSTDIPQSINEKKSIKELFYALKEYNDINELETNNKTISRDELMLKEIKILDNKSNKSLKELIEQKGINDFMKEKEYDLYPFVLMKYATMNLFNFDLFKDDFTNYIYNNLRALLSCKELDTELKKVAYNQENEFFFKEFLNFSNLRWEKFIEAGLKYNIELLQQYLDSVDPEFKMKKNNETNKDLDEEKFDINKAIEIYKNFPEDNQLEIFVSSLVYNSMINFILKEQKGQNNILNKNSIIPDKLEIQNFYLNEMTMISVLTGMKFNKNIVEINLSGNTLSPKSCFCLGSCFKTLPYLAVLDISKCDINNDKLYMLVEGTKFYTDENLNKEKFNLKKLNLKDNYDIIDNIKHNSFEHPISLLLEKCKLINLNLTNAKLGGKGAMKIFKKMEELLNKNELYIENLILISNNIMNEECLSTLGDLIINNKCPLKNLILSKNLISKYPESFSNPCFNYFEKFMKCVAKSKLKELFLINCEIGSYENDINILYNMLKENKSLISIRLFGNNISDMKSFTKILGIFSDYNKKLENSTLKSLDLSKNRCNIKIDENFMKLIENLKLEYLDVNQNNMEQDEKEMFRKRTNDLSNIRIIY